MERSCEVCGREGQLLDYSTQQAQIFAPIRRLTWTEGTAIQAREANRKGTVENAIQHTQATALKGRRFETLQEQN
ncbi:MAG: hypothetical protein EKK45_11060, partial [Curvibacter sp.]